MSLKVFIPLIGEAVEVDDTGSVSAATGNLVEQLRICEKEDCGAGDVCAETCKQFRMIGSAAEEYLSTLACSRVLVVFCSGVPLCIRIQGLADYQSLRLLTKESGEKGEFAVILVKAEYVADPAAAEQYRTVEIAGGVFIDRVKKIVETMGRINETLKSCKYRREISVERIDSVDFSSQLWFYLSEVRARMVIKKTREDGIIASMLI